MQNSNEFFQHFLSCAGLLSDARMRSWWSLWDRKSRYVSCKVINIEGMEWLSHSEAHSNSSHSCCHRPLRLIQVDGRLNHAFAQSRPAPLLGIIVFCVSYRSESHVLTAELHAVPLCRSRLSLEISSGWKERKQSCRQRMEGLLLLSQLRPVRLHSLRTAVLRRKACRNNTMNKQSDG